MWKETVDKEKNYKIYREEIKDFIPNRILDFHVHVFNEHVFPEGGPGFELPGMHIRSYTISETKQDMKKLYPGKEFSAVVFGFPDDKYNHEVNNRYVAADSDWKSIYPFRLLRPDEEPGKLEKELTSERFLGVKPYHCYVSGKETDEVEVVDMLPDPIMKVINNLGLIVMLHIPRPGRLADPLNQEQIAYLCKNYPDAKIVLAHIGRAYYLSNIVGCLDNLANLKNLYCDIAMLNNWEVLEYLFSNFDHKKILYGTDLPIGLCGGKSVEINNQYTYVTSDPWHLSISDDHKKLVFTSFIYEEIRAVIKAASRLKLGDSFVEDLFFNNGSNLLQRVL